MTAGGERGEASAAPGGGGAPEEDRAGERGRAAVLILCLGNAIRSDDAVALHVADRLEAEGGVPGAVVRRSAASGLYLLDDMDGFDRVVVVDAVRTGTRPPGSVLSFPLEDLRAPEGPSPHAIGLPSALGRARAAGAPVPSRVHVVAVEVEDMENVGERLTPAVSAAVGEAAGAVRDAVARVGAGGSRPHGARRG